ncbi:sensor histidine kinase [Glutamicibacter protophormiae]|uniref:sensor histidine kinase n=1 Tax=Glutamicibacter protophormiae TaxID=37930 RepID=UPI002A80A8A5|nr:sensor histidine kinase [Glutamicibacter protophormiae]WPR65891.1 sensor histidine kinase [Glutamicibacter protophormiae]WPR69389.1 sensor histidine kinase [Glutamicibacter protophormiae]
MTDHFADRPAAQAPPREPAPLTRDGWSFAVLIFAAQMLVVLLVVAGLAIATYQQQNRVILDDRQSTVAAVTITLANDPFVSESLTGPDATALLQPYANKILAHAQSLDFITIMTPDGIRVTHPNPQEIGQKYIGSTTQALNGEIFNEQAVGTLGNSVRTIAPVYHDGTVVGLVSSGYTLQNLQLQYRSELPQILLVSALALLLAGFSAWFFSRYVNQATLGFGPHGLRRLYAFYFSALHSVREGLVLLDRRHRIVLYNQEAARLLDLPEEVPGEGLNPQQVQMPETLRALMTTGRSCKDEIHLGAHTVLSVSQGPARLTNANLPRMGGPWRGWFGIQPLTGQVLTLRDLTEVQELAGELQSLKTFSTALRAQTHEHANRLHTIATLIESGKADQALAFAVDDRQHSQQLTDAIVHSIDDAYLSSLLVAKAAQAHERGIKLDISAQGFIPTDAFQATDIVTIVGNLLDNALDVSVGTEDATVWVEVTALGDELIIAVADSGPGIEPEFLENLLRFGVSTKSGVQPRGLGLALVQQAVLRLDGTMNVDNDAGAIFTVTLPFRPRT